MKVPRVRLPHAAPPSSENPVRLGSPYCTCREAHQTLSHPTVSCSYLFPFTPPQRVKMHSGNSFLSSQLRSHRLVLRACLGREATNRRPVRNGSSRDPDQVRSGNAVERNLEEVLRPPEAVFIAKILRVKTVAEEDVQALPVQAPTLGPFRERSLEVVGGAVEPRTEP